MAINLSGAQAFLVAGPAAARALAERVGVRTFPTYADSPLTAKVLAALGFRNVEAADDPSQVLLLRESAAGLETVEGDEFRRVITALEKDEVESFLSAEVLVDKLLDLPQ